jgi:hypothetical protein
MILNEIDESKGEHLRRVREARKRRGTGHPRVCRTIGPLPTWRTKGPSLPRNSPTKTVGIQRKTGSDAKML